MSPSVSQPSSMASLAAGIVDVRCSEPIAAAIKKEYLFRDGKDSMVTGELSLAPVCPSVLEPPSFSTHGQPLLSAGVPFTSLFAVQAADLQTHHPLNLRVDTSYSARSDQDHIDDGDWDEGFWLPLPPQPASSRSAPDPQWRAPKPHPSSAEDVKGPEVSVVYAHQLRTSMSWSGPAAPVLSPATSDPFPPSMIAHNPFTPDSRSNSSPTPTPTPTAPTPSKSRATDWLSGFFKASKPQPQSQSELSAMPIPTTSRTNSGSTDRQLSPTSQSYSGRATSQLLQNQPKPTHCTRCAAFDPADVAAELEVTSRVRRAAAEALMEAESKLLAAQKEVHLQAARADALEQELESLRRENAEILATRRLLESEMASSRQAVEAMRAAQESLQQELDELRTQAAERFYSIEDADNELQHLNDMLQSQMYETMSELEATRIRLSESESLRNKQLKELSNMRGQLEWLNKINKQLEASVVDLEETREQVCEVHDKYLRERTIRRQLQEELQRIKSCVKVICRVRPALSNQASIVTSKTEGQLTLCAPMSDPQEYEFDAVLLEDAPQQAVYEEVSPLVRTCADGYNVCIFAYGQSGSGKTHTMEGPETDPGITLRVFKELFNMGSEDAMWGHWFLEVRMLMITNTDSVLDLLAHPSDLLRPKELSDCPAGELPPSTERVMGATWVPVSCVEDVRKVLEEGSKNQSLISSALHAHSNRGTAVVTVRVSAEATNLELRSEVHLVDLAGSERVKESEVSAAQLKEAQNINKSLSALGDVISSLQQRAPEVPHNSCKLTQVLQDSLCGFSKILMVCNVSPDAASASETTSSLDFAAQLAQHEHLL